jgi:hypothetical protein
LFRSRNWRALRSACRTEWKERSNAEISPSGTIEQSICRNVKDCDLRFVSDCFDAEIGVRYVRRVEWSGKSV